LSKFKINPAEGSQGTRQLGSGKDYAGHILRAGYRQREGELTMTDHLLRSYAPIPTAGWQQIDDEAKSRLNSRLAARRIVDWAGPGGWRHSATNLGRTVWVPGLDGALVVSKCGSDFILDVGQDFAIGYSRHETEIVTLYLEESFSFRVNERDAVVVLAGA
jgi:uncharacterized linocin/CFP29 family protein